MPTGWRRAKAAANPECPAGRRGAAAQGAGVGQGGTKAPTAAAGQGAKKPSGRRIPWAGAKVRKATNACAVARLVVWLASAIG